MSGLPQLSRRDLGRLNPEQITAAHRAGRLADLLGGRCPPDSLPAPDPDHAAGQLSRADLKGMKPEQIEAARKAGRLTSLGIGR